MLSFLRDNNIIKDNGSKILTAKLYEDGKIERFNEEGKINMTMLTEMSYIKTIIKCVEIVIKTVCFKKLTMEVD